jgi:hypothetical protein
MGGFPTMRKRLLIVAAVIVVLGAAAAWRLRLPDLARIGTGYTAEQTCACLFVSRRSLESCRAELDPLAKRLVSLTAGSNEVTARSMLIAHATARYEKGFGCTLTD